MGIKLKKDIEKLYPELKKTLVLETKSGVFYAWKDGECHQYKNKTCEEVTSGLKNPLVLQQGNYNYAFNGVIIKNCGDYISVTDVSVVGMSVKEFKKEEPRLRLGHPWSNRNVTERRFYKNRKVLIVNHYLFDNGDYVSYIPDPSFNDLCDSLNEYRVGGVYSVEALHNGNQHFLYEGEVELGDYRKKISKSNKGELTSSCLYFMDIAHKCVHEIATKDHYDSNGGLILADSTQQIIKEFYKDVDLAIWHLYKKESIRSLEDLVDFCCVASPERAAKMATKKEREEALFFSLKNKLGQGVREDNSLVFDREGDEILVYSYKNGDYSRYLYAWYVKKGEAILIYNIKKKTKKLFIRKIDDKTGEVRLVIPVPTKDIVKDWFDVSPGVAVKAQYASYVRYYEAESSQMELRRFTEPIYLKDKKEIFHKTNIELFMEGEGIPYPRDLGPEHFGDLTDSKTVQDSLKYCSGLFWEILLGDNIIEQLLKQNLVYLAFAKISHSGFGDIDKNKSRWHTRIEYHGKEKSLKKCFGLSMKQLSIVNSFIKEHLLAQIGERNALKNGYQGGLPPIIPAVAGMDEALGVQLNCMDLETFQTLLGLSDQKGEYGWFAWSDLTYHVALKEEITSKMSPATFIQWLGKGFNFREYDDYLRMRKTLKQMAIDTGDTDLFSEVAFPVNVKTPEEVHRLHEIVSTIKFNNENKVKAQMFNNALAEAKCYEFEDEEGETEDRMCVVTPTSVPDLVAEGTALNHCVKSPMWIDAIAKRESVIMFIRKCSDKDTPYFTVELDPHGAIRQCHGNCNCDPDKSVIKFLGRWANACKGVLKESILKHYSALCAPSR
jgi:hypothetical protein